MGGEPLVESAYARLIVGQGLASSFRRWGAESGVKVLFSWDNADCLGLCMTRRGARSWCATTGLYPAVVLESGNVPAVGV